MKEFQKREGFKPRFGGGSRFGGAPKRFGGKPGGFRSGGTGHPPTLYDTTCGDCGKDCKVPFRPTGERPLYCRDCFSKHAPAPREGGFKKEFKRNDRPFRDAPRFENHSAPRPQASANPEMTKQLEAMNVKLDRLISIFEKQAHASNVNQALKSIDTTPQKPKARKSAKK